MAKYLILKTGALGDISYLLPAIDQIHHTDPRAEITWIAGNIYGDFLRKYPLLHRVIEVNEKRLFQRSLIQRLAEAFQLWRQLDSYYDQIWIGHRTLAAFLLLKLRVRGKIFQIVRAPSRLLARFRNETVVTPLSLHESRAFKALTEKALGRPIPFESWINPDLSWIKTQPLSSIPRIVVHIGGGANQKTEFVLKKWPHWATFLKQLNEQPLSYELILIGSSNEREEAQALLQTEPSLQGRVRSLVGETSIYELIGILKSSRLFIGVDSGPLHWADLLGVPCIGIYGPTSTVSWGLLGEKSRAIFCTVPCSPCYRDDGFFPQCPNHHKCMVELNPGIVFELFKQNYYPMLGSER